MVGAIVVVLGAVVGAAAVVGGMFFFGLRRKSPTIRRAVRGFARRIVNPRMLRTAGTPGAYASVIHHVGRTSGRSYLTPVVAKPTTDGFVIALPYGTSSNWVKNVMASGSATLVHEGAAYRVDNPTLGPLSPWADRFPPKEQRSHERFRVDQCLRLHRAN